MSNYERNNTMVACILAFILVGAIAIGALTFLGNSPFNWGFGNWSNPDWTDTTSFEFDRTEASMPATVTLNLDLTVGDVNIQFDDNSTLLYEIVVEVPNNILEQTDDPEITFASNTIGLDYPVAGVNITLGNSVTYVIDINVETGNVDLVLGQYASVGTVDVIITTGVVSIILDDTAAVDNIDLDVTTGSIDLSMTDDSSLTGDVTFDLDVTTGDIDVLIDLNSSYGGDYRGLTSVGTADVTDSGWDEIGTGHYQTSNYYTASQTLTITADVTTGDLDATLIH